MKLIILGSGTCVPSLKRSSPANFLKIKKNNILIDCGPGTMRQLLKAGLDYKAIDFIFLTHFHFDHISELGSIIQALDWTPYFDRKKDLILAGPVGFKSFYRKTINSKPRPNTYRIKIMEIKRRSIFSGFNVECTKTIHSKESIAYKFIENSKSLIITGDCDYSENLIKFSKNANLLLTECSYPDHFKAFGHLVPKECGEIAKRANVKKLVLTHLYLPFSEIMKLKETKRIFKNTILAKDLLTLNI